jgi:hypothetical protein
MFWVKRREGPKMDHGMKWMIVSTAMVIATSLVGGAAWGGELRQVVTVDPGGLFIGQRDGYDVVELEGYRYPTDVGKPMLPVTVVTVALPGLVEITGIDVISTDAVALEGSYRIMPTQRPLPLVNPLPTRVELVPPDEEIYGSGRPYPESVVTLVNTADLDGRSLAHIRIAPVQYVPREGRLIFTRRIEYVVRYRDATPGEGPHTVSVPPGDYDYVILTSSSLVSAFQPLADWKEKKGLKSIIVTMNDIQDWYGGTGTSQVRSFVRDAHQDWGAEWILLAGDVDIIPEKWKSFYGPGSTYGDTYYADYDDDWVCEVAVGRASVNTTAEVQIFVDKVLVYEKDPSLTNYPLDVTLIMMDLDSITYCEESCEYYIVPNIPGRFDITKIYDSHYGNHETAAVNAFNDGQNVSIHMDHSGSDGIGIGWVNHGWFLESSELIDFTNYQETAIMYTGGCHPGDFEISDCFGEYWVFKHADEVGVGFIGNAGYGWYQRECCHCLSGEYMVAFSHSLFQEERHHLGDALNDHKNDTPPDDNYMRYVFYTLNLLGDPEMPVWLDTPGDMTVTHATQIPVGAQDFTVTVEEGSTGIEGARVCLMKGDEVYEVGFTNGSGEVTITINPTTEGTMDITVTAYDYLPYEGTVSVIGAVSPDLIYHSHTIDDDDVGGSSGNGDGTVDAGEAIELPVVLENVGTGGATDVTALFGASGDPYVTITDNYEEYGDIGAGGTGQSLEDYDFQVSSDCPDGHTIDFILDIASNEGSWQDVFVVQVQAPVVVYESHEIDDTVGGNGNGEAEPGETVEIEVTLQNTGSGEALGVTASLSTSDLYIDVVVSDAGYGDILSGGYGVSVPPYQVFVHEDCPGPHTAQMTLSIVTATGQQFTRVFDLEIAGVADVVYHSHTIDDDDVGGSSGNGDGTVDAGETIELPVVLENVGTRGATGVAATLGVSGDPYVTITDNYEEYGDIGAGGTGQSLEDYDFQVSSDCPDGHTIDFMLDIASNEGSWQDVFAVQVQAPVVVYDSHEIDDSVGGDGDGKAEPGETVEIEVTLQNMGSGEALGVTASLSTSDLYIDVVVSDAGYGEILSGGYGVSVPPYQVFIHEDCPGPHTAQMTLSIVTATGQQFTEVFTIEITLPGLVVTLEPDATVIPRGGFLGYTVIVTNNGDSTVNVDYWTDIILWNGEPYGKNPIFGPKGVKMNPGQTRQGHISHSVPGTAPLKTYTCCGRIGVHPDDIWEEDCFQFTIVEGAGGAESQSAWDVIEENF